MAKIIYDSGIGDFLESIAGEMIVYAPVYFDRQHPDQVAFKEWHPKSRLALNYPVTIMPPKEFLMPNGEVLFGYDGELLSQPKPDKQVIFGLSVEDLEGVTRLDKIMSAPVNDEPYARRREGTFIIGLDRYSPPAGLNYDLYLEEFEPGVFSATARTRQGKKWLTGKHFKTQTVQNIRTGKRNDPVLTDPRLGKAIKESADHPIWDELTEQCFGCGICSYVCPLCYCFDTQDGTDFGNDGCTERCRNWDSCFSANFAATSNHNFRPELKDRIYNWYYHKFYRLPREQGISGCVDCSRCVVYCPAKINFRRVLARVLDDYKKRPAK